MYKKVNTEKITRLEVINHAKNNKPIGRILTLYKELKDFDFLDIDLQDGGKTLKIFLSSKNEELFCDKAESNLKEKNL